LLLGKDNTQGTTWLSAEEWSNSGTLHKGWECAKQKLLTEEINILVLGTYNSGRTACHWAAERENQRYYKKYVCGLKRNNNIGD